VTAKVLSPISTTLCVNTNKEELAQIVWDTWDDMAFDPDRWTTIELNEEIDTNNETVLDNVFGCGAPPDEQSRIPRPGKPHFIGSYQRLLIIRMVFP
jgi:hypothetical protein